MAFSSAAAEDAAAGEIEYVLVAAAIMAFSSAAAEDAAVGERLEAAASLEGTA